MTGRDGMRWDGFHLGDITWGHPMGCVEHWAQSSSKCVRPRGMGVSVIPQTSGHCRALDLG